MPVVLLLRLNVTLAAQSVSRQSHRLVRSRRHSARRLVYSRIYYKPSRDSVCRQCVSRDTQTHYVYSLSHRPAT